MLDVISFNQNTFPLIYEQDSSLPIVYFKLLFKNSGRAYDEIAGEASFFARLLNEGSDDSFFKELELRAINLSASADFETFDISIDCLKEHFPFAIKKLYSLLLKPNFSDKILSRLKNTVLGELASKNSDFDYLAKRLLDKTVYPYKEFQSSMDGDEKSIKDINLNALKRYYENLLNSENLVLCIGGDLKKDDFIREISPILELFSSKKTEKKHFDFVEVKKDGIYIDGKKAEMKDGRFVFEIQNTKIPVVSTSLGWNAGSYWGWFIFSGLLLGLIFLIQLFRKSS